MGTNDGSIKIGAKSDVWVKRSKDGYLHVPAKLRVGQYNIEDLIKKVIKQTLGVANANGLKAVCGCSGSGPGPTPKPKPPTPKPKPPSACSDEIYKGDGNCDDGNNNAGCDYDGGDCCEKSLGKKVVKTYCNQVSGCKCL